MAGERRHPWSPVRGAGRHTGVVNGAAAGTQALLHAVAHRFRLRGERMTRPRRAVLTVLARDGGHLSADAIYTGVAALDPAVHRASVYRTLEALSELGIVQHLHGTHGGAAYHLIGTPGAHVHGQCGACGVVVDLPADLLDDVAARVATEAGFLLDPTHVALSGTCAACTSARP